MANTTLDTIDVVTNTFRNWVDKTNDAIQVLRNQAVTVSNTVAGDTVNGNGFVVGFLGANTLGATTLRGGNNTTLANLAIITNTNITAAFVNVAANTLIYSNSTVAAAVFGGNTTATNSTFNSTYFNVNSNTTIVGSAHVVTGNVNIDSGTLFVDSVNNRIGVNTIAPSAAVTVNGSVIITGTVDVAHMKIIANSATTSGTTQVAVDTFAAASYRTGKYTVSITDTTSPAVFQAAELLVMHDGTNSYVTEYAVLRNGSNLGTFASDISSGNVRLLFTPTVATSSIKFTRTLVGV